MNIALPIILFFLLGILLHYIDLKIGVGIYSWWYKLTHKDPLPVGTEKGFIAGSSFGAKLFIAIIFITAEVLLSFQIGNSPPLLDLLLGILGLIGLMLGFYLGGKIMNTVGGGVKKTTEYIEQIESGETDLKKVLSKGILKAGAALKEGSEQFKENMADKEVKEEQAEEAGQKEDENIEENKPKDWREGVDDFLKNK